MEGQLAELVQFLRDQNPQVRTIALSNLLSYTPQDSPYRNIFFVNLQGPGAPKENNVIKSLKALCRDDLAIAHDAFRALVNLSDSQLLEGALSESLFLQFLVSYIINPSSILADIASMLLSNITAFPAACTSLCSLEIPIVENPETAGIFYPPLAICPTSTIPQLFSNRKTGRILALPLLIKAFVDGASSNKKREGNLHFLSSVFANISALPVGQQYFTSPRPINPLSSEGELEIPLSQLLVFTEHQDAIRRRGVASTIKNCTFQVKAHKLLMTAETELDVGPSGKQAPGANILIYILLPLAGPEEFDLDDQERLPTALQFLPDTKKREPIPSIRLKHIESLLLLCTTRWGRELQRSSGVYEIIRTMHASETDDKVSEHIERLVNLLKRDEGREVQEIEAAVKTNLSEVKSAGNGDEENDEDLRIEEI